MKRQFFFPLLGAVLLFLTAACEQPDINPNFNPETNEVVTNFIFNISTSSQAKTKQSAAVTQQEGEIFRGIDNAKLFYYQQDSDGKILVEDADVTDENMNDLKTVAAYNTLSSSKSTRVLEMSLPLKTNTMLFYGKAIAADPADHETYGYMSSYSISKTAGSTKFELGQRLGYIPEGGTAESGQAAKDRFYAVEKCLSAALSIIMNTNLASGDARRDVNASWTPSGSTGTNPINNLGFPITATEMGTLHWRDYLTMTKPYFDPSASELTELEKRMKSTYREMTTIYTSDGELRAASGSSIIKTVADLWSNINAIRCAAPMEKSEALAKYLAEQINLRLQRYFTCTSIPNDGGAILEGNLSFNTAFIANLTADLASELRGVTTPNVTAPSSLPEGETADMYQYTDIWPTSSELSLASVDGIFEEFPFNFNLPRGATHIAFENRRLIFYYPKTFNTGEMGGVMAGSNYNAESYYYPAELMYFGNSPLYVTDTEHGASSYPQTSTSWRDAGEWSNDWSIGRVKASTRAVAMQYDINYGTALLETHVKYHSTESTGTGEDTKYYLLDNNRAIQARLQGRNPADPGADFTEQDKKIEITGTTFKFMGIIIGSQPHRVGWDYLPIVASGFSTYENGFVYDKSIPEAAQVIPVTGSSAANYTLLLDNYNEPSGADQPGVSVALEFQNNSGVDFYGNHNVIKQGGYFYLIANLVIPTEEKNKVSTYWPTTYNYVHPPYNADGTSKHILRVFMQDYKTVATFSMNTNSLKAAYLTVPDLRSGALTLGLSVNLDWQTGINFEDVPLGGMSD